MMLYYISIVCSTHSFRVGQISRVREKDEEVIKVIEEIKKLESKLREDEWKIK